MIKFLAFQMFGMFLQNLLGTEFFTAITQAVQAATLFDKPGAERKAMVLESLERAMASGKLAGAQTATWAVNLAVEYAVAQIKLAAPEQK